MRIFTVGHGTRPIEEFLSVLQSASVRELIDVRRFPGSRRHPQFGRESLEQSLADARIRYEWWGEELGGRRSRAKGPTRHPAWRVASFQGYADHMDTDEFRVALEKLIELASAQPTAIMCAETLWWKCHRRLISDALALREVDVVHLMTAAKSEPHKLHPAVRVDEEGRPVYDVGTTEQFNL
ncbi:MAG TPA: DUF488 domain-containing protein [Actinomycetota bacterium]|nr:DUF488 domain-containing protein [Actinomycetota bacterium]